MAATAGVLIFFFIFVLVITAIVLIYSEQTKNPVKYPPNIPQPGATVAVPPGANKSIPPTAASP